MLPQYHIKTGRLIVGIAIILLGFYVMMKFTSTEALIGSFFIMSIGGIIAAKSRIPIYY